MYFVRLQDKYDNGFDHKIKKSKLKFQLSIGSHHLFILFSLSFSLK